MTAYSLNTKSIALVDETLALRRCALYRNAFRGTAISHPAALLGFNAVANWIRRHRVAVDVTTAGELEGAVSAAVLCASSCTSGTGMRRRSAAL